MKREKGEGQILYQSAAKKSKKKSKKVLAALMAALMVGSVVDYTALPVVYATEDNTSKQVAELTQNGETEVYGSFMEAYQAITTSDKVTIKLLQDSKISKINEGNIYYICDSGHTIVLDLNGHTLSTEEVPGWESNTGTYVLLIDNSSNWTICSGVPGGKIQDSYSKEALFENYGTLSVGENVEITSKSDYTLYAYYAYGGDGILSIDGATVDKVGASYGACKITSGNIGNAIWHGGNVEISGGKIGTVSVIGDIDGWNSGKLQLSGGTIDLLKQREAYTKAMATWFATGTAIRNTKDDSFYTRAGIDAIEAVDGYRCVENIAVVPCENHVNESGYCKYCATATECEHIYGEDGSCTNCGLAATATIKKDNQLNGYVTYEELCQAVSEFTADTTATIKIFKDVALNQCLTFQEGKIILDLSGHKIETSATETVRVSDNAEVTIQNGTLRNSDRSNTIWVDGGKLTLGKNVTVSSYRNYNVGLYITGGEVTIDGAEFVDGESSVVAYSGSLTVLDGTFNGGLLKDKDWGELPIPEVTLKGGSYSDVSATTGNLRSMLGNGYGFRSREEGTAWIVDSDLLDGESTGYKLSNVTVEKLPLTITQPESGEVYYGEEATLSVAVDAAEEVTYQWYHITEEGTAEEVSGATSATLTVPANYSEPGVADTFYCVIHWQGYSVKSEEATLAQKLPMNHYIYDAIEKYYTGEAVTLQEDEISIYPDASSAEDKLVAGVDFKIVEESYDNNIDATTQDKMASVTVEGIGKYTGTVQVRFSILQAENKFMKEITCEDYVYDGVTAPNPEATAKFGTVKYRYAASETGEYTDTVPMNAGTYYVKAYVEETNNYTGLESKEAVKFVISKAKQPENTPKDSITTAYTVKKVSEAELPSDWQWAEEDAEKDLPEAEAVEAKANYIGQDKDNYETKQITITIIRSACEHPDTKVEGKKAATCTTAGYTGDTYCEQCERMIKEGTEIALLPHTLEKIEKKDATTVEEGNIEYYHCSVCDSYFSDSEGKKQITKESTVIPTIEVTPTVEPSAEPSANPSAVPTANPTVEPSAEPSANPSAVPTANPTVTPSAEPSAEPTAVPTANPTVIPSAVPTANPTAGSGAKPTTKPSVNVKPAAKGTKLTDSTGASYRVTSSQSSSPTLEYVAPPKGAKGTIKILNQVKLDGVTYKITSIGSGAFKNNTKVKKVTIGKNVTRIGKQAFSGCKKLKTVVIGENVSVISQKAFYKCGSLTSITIPKKVKSIGKNAFASCKKLKHINIKTTKLTKSSVGSNAFKGISAKAVVKVPKSKLNAYKKLLMKKGIGEKAKFTK